MPRPSNAETKAAMEVYKPPGELATTDRLPPFESIIERLGGMAPEAVEKLLAVYRELKADKAEEAYNVAFAAFQADCPEIPRNRAAKFVTSGGGSVNYTYADLEQTMRTIRPVLEAHNLSVSFDDSTVDGSMLTAICRCSHIGGHSCVSRFTVTIESKAGMSPQQKYGNAETYAHRRALNSRLGLTTGDPDTDGASPAEPSPLLTEQQRQHIADLAGKTKTDWDSLLRWWGVPNFADACQDKYEAAVRFLNQRKQQQTKGKT